jgi:hypothetical protein
MVSYTVDGQSKVIICGKTDQVSARRKGEGEKIEERLDEVQVVIKSTEEKNSKQKSRADNH